MQFICEGSGLRAQGSGVTRNNSKKSGNTITSIFKTVTCLEIAMVSVLSQNR